MIKRQNFKELKKTLEDYCNSSSFEHPFIIAGWPGSGKSALIEDVKKKYPALSSEDYNLEYEVDSIELDSKQKHIIEEWNKPLNEPKIISITCGVVLASLRDIMLAGCDIHILEVDTACWLEWAKEPNAMGISNIEPGIVALIERNPSLIHSNISLRKDALDEMDNYLCMLEEDDAVSFHETFTAINNIFIAMQKFFLTKAEADPIFNRMLDALFSIREKADEDFLDRLERTVMQMGSLYAKQFPS